ncbi:MAG: LexA family protein [Candidatus Saccharimonadales bacterium]
MSETRPSKKQRELLSFIDGFIAGHGYGPSYREIMRGLGYKSVSTVAIHVDNLIRKGHLRKRDHSARSLEVVQTAAEFKGLSEVNQSQEKWLVDLISERFTAVEKIAKPSQKAIDDLFVLVGSLQVLGLADAATSFKSRLITLTKK